MRVCQFPSRGLVKPKRWRLFSGKRLGLLKRKGSDTTFQTVPSIATDEYVACIHYDYR